MKNTIKTQLSLSRFLISEHGVTAVEFALIAPVLMYTLMGIIEIALMFFAFVHIDGAAIDAARRIRTGQAQSSGDAEGDFYSTFCSGLSSAITCGDVFYDARTVSSFSAATLETEIDEDTGEPVTYGFSAGGASDIIVVRVMYLWDFSTPLIGNFFESTAGTDSRLLISTVVFQNESYE